MHPQPQTYVRSWRLSAGQPGLHPSRREFKTCKKPILQQRRPLFQPQHHCRCSRRLPQARPKQQPREHLPWAQCGPSTAAIVQPVLPVTPLGRGVTVTASAKAIYSPPRLYWRYLSGPPTTWADGPQLRNAGQLIFSSPLLSRPLVWTATAPVTRTLQYAADIASSRNGQQMSAKSLRRRLKHEIQVALLRQRAAMTRPVLPNLSARAEWLFAGIIDGALHHWGHALATTTMQTPRLTQPYQMTTKTSPPSMNRPHLCSHQDSSCPLLPSRGSLLPSLR